MADLVETEPDFSADAVPPAYAALALGLTAGDWSALGVDQNDDCYDNDDDEEDMDSSQGLLETIKKRMTSILLVRLVALLAKNRAAFPDLASSTICRTVLVQDHHWAVYAPAITEDFLTQLRQFVSTILDGYHETPYHCSEHAFHVTLSVNKLIDLMLQTDPDTTKTFGLRHDALAQFAMLFAALIHDVEHKGVPNRQLVTENDPLAVLYNDESVAEQRSLFIAFDLLLSPDFTILRETILGGPVETDGAETYRRFRKIVINLVLSTDIASPERTQVAKSKWKEAFGDTFESIERKLKQHLGENSASGGAPGGGDNESFYGVGDEDSISETPDSSEADHDNTSNNHIDHMSSPSGGQSTNDVVLQNFDELVSVASGMSFRSKGGDVGKYGNNRSFRGGRRRSTNTVPSSRRASLQLLQSDEVYKAKFQRRMSSYSGGPKQSIARRASGFRKRLGIRRSMDLSGESLEVYRRVGHDANTDEPDDFKAQVVMETIITAADVAHNLQGWDQMVVWSGRLYLELRKAFIEGRGADPKIRWFENQIGFLESYLLPLARRLEDADVFGDNIGMMFTQIVEQNRDKWLEEGSEITEAIIARGAEIYNEETLAEEREAISQQTRLTGRGNGLKFRGTNLAVLGSM